MAEEIRSEIKIVAISGILIIGRVYGDNDYMTTPYLIRPAGENQVQFQNFVGMPEKIWLHNIGLSYIPDEEILKAYIKIVTNLVIASGIKPN